MAVRMVSPSVQRVWLVVASGVEGFHCLFLIGRRCHSRAVFVQLYAGIVIQTKRRHVFIQRGNSPYCCRCRLRCCPSGSPARRRNSYRKPQEHGKHSYTMGAAGVGINPAARIGYTCILEQPLIHDGRAWRNRACFQTCQCSNHLEGGAGCLFSASADG